MSRISKPLKSDQDDRLADFTNEVIAGQAQINASNADEELILLEETVLRLNIAYPPINLDEARAKQMYVRLKNRIRREEQERNRPIWVKWFSLSQVRIAAGALSLLIVFVLVLPALSTTGSSTTATALTPAPGPLLVIALAGVILIVLWIKRRK